MFKKWLYTILAVLVLSATGFSEKTTFLGEGKELLNGVGKAFDDLLISFKNNTVLREHLFVGDLKNTTGCHYFNAVDDINIRFIDDVNTLPVNSKGVIKGNIEMQKEVLKSGGISYEPKQFTWKKKYIPNGEEQTFFPKTWSQDKILEECASAISKPNKSLVPGKTRMFHAESNSGVWIRWFEDANGNVASMFPAF